MIAKMGLTVCAFLAVAAMQKFDVSSAPAPTPIEVATIVANDIGTGVQPSDVLAQTCTRRVSQLYGAVFACQAQVSAGEERAARHVTLTLAAFDGVWVIASR
jgi:hypothetical protein